MKISFAKPSRPTVGVYVVFLAEGGKLAGFCADLDKDAHGLIGRAMKAQAFTGKKEQQLSIAAPVEGIDQLLLLGIGKPADLGAREIELLGGVIGGLLGASKSRSAVVAPLPLPDKGLSESEGAALLASGLRLRTYHFEIYKTKKKETSQIASVSFQTTAPTQAQKQYAAWDAVAEGNHMARDLVNEPANILTPIAFATRAKALSKAGVKVDILTPEQMKKLGMGALLGVGQGSANPPRLVVMRWDGGKAGVAPVAFIGKGGHV